MINQIQSKLDKKLTLRIKFDPISPEIRFEIKFKHIPKLIDELSHYYDRFNKSKLKTKEGEK